MPTSSHQPKNVNKCVQKFQYLIPKCRVEDKEHPTYSW